MISSNADTLKSLQWVSQTYEPTQAHTLVKGQSYYWLMCLVILYS